jgi:hypothetical protein
MEEIVGDFRTNEKQQFPASMAGKTENQPA